MEWTPIKKSDALSEARSHCISQGDYVGNEQLLVLVNASEKFCHKLQLYNTLIKSYLGYEAIPCHKVALDV